MYFIKTTLIALLSFLFLFNFVFAEHSQDVRPIATRIERRVPKIFGKRNLYQMFTNLMGTDRFVGSGAENQWTFPMGVTEYTTAEFYGCTIIIIMGEKDVGIAHFREFLPGGDSTKCVLVQSALTKAKLTPKLEQMFALKDYSCDQSRALVIASVGKGTPGVKVIKSDLEDAMVDQARFVEYTPNGGAMGEAPLAGPSGKVGVRVTKTANSVTIEIFLMQDTPNIRVVWNNDGQITSENWPASAKLL